MKYKFYDTQNDCWYRPVYEANKRKVEEILVSQSGELCMRKIEGDLMTFEHESMFPERFIKCIYTGKRDKDGHKIYQNDVIRLPDGKVKLVEYEDSGAWIGYGILDGCELLGNIYQDKELLTIHNPIKQ